MAQRQARACAARRTLADWRSCYIARLPVELVRAVIREALAELPSRSTIETRLYHTASAQRMASLRELHLVCRAWTPIAHSLLPEHLVCYDLNMGKRHEVVGRSELRAAVRSLTFGRFIGQKAYEQMAGMVQACDGLETLVIAQPPERDRPLTLPKSIRHVVARGWLPALTPGSSRPTSVAIGEPDSLSRDGMTRETYGLYRDAVRFLTLPLRRFDRLGTSDMRSALLRTLAVELGDSDLAPPWAGPLAALPPSITDMTVSLTWQPRDMLDVRLAWLNQTLLGMPDSVSTLTLACNVRGTNVAIMLTAANCAVRVLVLTLRGRARIAVRHLKLALRFDSEEATAGVAAAVRADSDGLVEDIRAQCRARSMLLDVEVVLRRAADDPKPRASCARSARSSSR